MRHLLLLALAGCDLAFPVHLDNPGPEHGPLMPPGGSTVCPLAPTVATWTFLPDPLAGFAGVVEHPTFAAPDRVMFTSAGTLYETTLDGPPSHITDLDLSDGSKLTGVAAAPGGNAIWYERVAATAPSAGLKYATRVDGRWIEARADFELAAAELQIGSIGFYDATARMVIGFTPPEPGQRIRLLELESTDGLQWTALDPLPISDGSAFADFEPSLSADGCTLAFHRLTDIMVSQREADGRFVTATPVPQVAPDGSQPAIAPLAERLWVIRNNAVFEGLP